MLWEHGLFRAKCFGCTLEVFLSHTCLTLILNSNTQKFAINGLFLLEFLQHIKDVAMNKVGTFL